MNPMLRTIRTCMSAAVTCRHSKYSTLPSEAVIFTEDNNMVVCWHPEKQFPYEYSLPLPEEKRDTSMLSIGEKDVAEVFWKKTNQEVVNELAKITYTTGHRWLDRKRDRKAKQTKPDRPYL